MDLAQTLVRSVVRAFYDDHQTFDRRHILVVDALVIHSALRDDDMSYLMNMNLKDLHKICGRLREDRFIQVYGFPHHLPFGPSGALIFSSADMSGPNSEMVSNDRQTVHTIS